MSDPNNIAPNTHTSNSKLANWRLLCLWTRAGDQPIVVKKILWNLAMFYGLYPVTEI